MSQLIMGIAIGIVVTAIGLLFHILYEQWKQKQNRQKEGLRKHFEDLGDEVIRPLIAELERYMNDYGEFHPKPRGVIPLSESDDTPIMPSLDISGIKSADLYRSFELHFPNETERWDKFKNGVCEHNITCASFTEQLEERIGNIGKLPFAPPAASECHIDGRLPTQMRKTLYQLIRQQEYPNPNLLYDFTKTTVQIEHGKEQVKLVFEEYKAREPLVIASGWDEAERYQAHLKNLQQSPGLREEALQL
ncbi:MAG: hypothetical protein KAW81_03655 [Dehalococcoidia bacterium]|nr:hypothetical protein [Dehalococcoidia bacterium]